MAAVALSLATIAITLTGGLDTAIGSFRIRAHTPWRPLVFAVALAGVAFAARRCRQAAPAELTRWWTGLDRAAPFLAALAAALTLWMGVAYGTFVAGGADSYGYVSQARLWASGRLHTYQPIAHAVPWPEADWTLTPLGYRPARRSGYIVPSYAPGLPLMMAAALALRGEKAVYFVVPFLGALTVWFSFLLGRRLSDGRTGLVAAVLTALSPVFLFQLMQPMSDVPGAAFWLAAGWLGAQGGALFSAVAGVASAVAVVIRPNTAPLAIVIAALIVAVTYRERRARGTTFALVAFGLGLAPGVAGVTAINDALYGSPLVSGYGTLAELYSWTNVGPNAGRYHRWMLETQSRFIYLALAAPLALVWARRQRAGGDATDRPHRSSVTLSLAILAFMTVLAACYLPYFVFSDWSYLRFLLPGIPALLAASAATLVIGIRQLPAPVRAPTLLIVLTMMGGMYQRAAAEKRTFVMHRWERRYIDAAEYARDVLPRNAVMVSMQHSGSLRHYGQRLTLRWDFLDPTWLDRAIEYFQQSGRPSYIVLEAWEEPDFRRRFQKASTYAALDWPPLAEVQGPMRVRIYNVRDRSRFLAGERIHTEPIGLQ